MAQFNISCNSFPEPSTDLRSLPWLFTRALPQWTTARRVDFQEQGRGITCLQAYAVQRLLINCGAGDRGGVLRNVRKRAANLAVHVERCALSEPAAAKVFYLRSCLTTRELRQVSRRIVGCGASQMIYVFCRLVAQPQPRLRGPMCTCLVKSNARVHSLSCRRRRRGCSFCHRSLDKVSLALAKHKMNAKRTFAKRARAGHFSPSNSIFNVLITSAASMSASRISFSDSALARSDATLRSIRTSLDRWLLATLIRARMS